MRSAFASVLISLSIVLTPEFADTSEKNNTKFTSIYTDLQKDCKDKFSESEEGQDMPLICKGPGGYWIDVEISACCEHLHVIGKSGFTLYFPMQRLVTVMKRKMEWRLANGKPFAVIFRIDKYNGDITMFPKKANEILIVKGLKGFEGIDHSVETIFNLNPNNICRELADKGYKQRKAK